MEVIPDITMVPVPAVIAPSAVQVTTCPTTAQANAPPPANVVLT